MHGQSDSEESFSSVTSSAHGNHDKSNNLWKLIYRAEKQGECLNKFLKILNANQQDMLNNIQWKLKLTKSWIWKFYLVTGPEAHWSCFTVLNVPWRQSLNIPKQNESVLIVCKVHLKLTVYFQRNKQRTLLKFLRQNWVPTKLQKSCWLEAHWMFSITPQKMQQKSWFQGIFGVWIWNTKFRLDKGECVQQNFIEHIHLRILNISHSRHK